jgi:hypothetical protein
MLPMEEFAVCDNAKLLAQCGHRLHFQQWKSMMAVLFSSSMFNTQAVAAQDHTAD